jgi:hypothetical protein
MKFLIILVSIIALGCGPVYHQCSQADLAKFRCNGDTIELCDGHQWFINGVPAPQRCVEEGDGAFCGEL